MKTELVPRITILSMFIIVLQQAGFSQELSTGEDIHSSHSLHSAKLISTYREFFKWEEYDQAMDSWWTIFNDYPDISERFYVDGVTMYHYFIEHTPEGRVRNNKIDTLMLIYDQRMTYFDGRGNILGRKGSDLLLYRSDNTEKVLEAYDMLKESLELEGTGSREQIMLNTIAAGLLLNKSARLDKNQVLEDYFQVTGLLDRQGERNSRQERTRSTIDGMIQNEDILSCNGLDLHFGPEFEQSSGDPVMLEKIIDAYNSVECNQSALYLAVSERLFELNHSSELAHQVAVLFIGRNDLEKAAWYLEMAVLDDQIPDETRAQWFYELSIVSLAKGDHCEAISFAREAKAYKDDYGKAYMALGDAFIAYREQLGDDFQQRSAYWAAADMYQAAARVEPELAEESSEKLAICVSQYPSTEDIFFQDLKVGNSFLVGRCIQENTTIRSRD